RLMPTLFPYTPLFRSHPLRKQAGRRLAMLDEPQVPHHLAPEPRVQQVQNGVRDSPDVLVDRKPVANLRRIIRRLIIVRVAVAVRSEEHTSELQSRFDL